MILRSSLAFRRLSFLVVFSWAFRRLRLLVFLRASFRRLRPRVFFSLAFCHLRALAVFSLALRRFHQLGATAVFDRSLASETGGGRMGKATMPRDAFNLAHSLYDQATSPAEALVDFNLADTLGQPEAYGCRVEKVGVSRC
jgi:hypothetical protein